MNVLNVIPTCVIISFNNKHHDYNYNLIKINVLIILNKVFSFCIKFIYKFYE
jgi:hypothetical protein